jgi:type 2 lantibiotic biosynthesis protein LanM
MHERLRREYSWYNASTLAERSASLQNQLHEVNNSNIDSVLAQYRLEKWKSQAPFAKGSLFAQRLAMDGITEEELLMILGESSATLESFFLDIPSWLLEIARAFFYPHRSCTEAKTIISLEEISKHKQVGFLFAAEPLISQGIDRLEIGIKKLIEIYPAIPFDPNTISQLLLDNLKGKLLMLLSRTLVLELNIARLQGLLNGETPEARFESFIERLKQRELVVPILEEYPVLARQLVICIDYWLDFSLEFLQNLCMDWQDICKTLSPDLDPGILTEMLSGVGDTHRGGRSVNIAKFSSGFQVVYKPNSLAVDLHFQQLLEWLNQHSNLPAFRTLKVLNRKSYGWVEFVTSTGCKTSEEIYRFYQRQGAYLALLYAMEATDFHHENLIAAGEHPILVDLEALFHPRIEDINPKDADNLSMETMGYSVLRIGLLPQRIWANAESEGVEISGLGGKAGQLTPNPVKYLADVGTDEMHVERERKPMPGSNNLPKLNDKEVNVLDYSEAIIDGFSSIYRLLVQYRDELLAEHSPLATFGEDRVRFIMRATSTYAHILHESYHPDLLRNALDRDRLFDRLWLQVEHNPYLEKVIRAEHQDFWNGDIPMFSTSPNSQDLWTSTGEKIPNFFEQSGMTQVRNRLQKLCEEDLEQQLWFVQASLTTLAMTEEGGKWPSYPISEPRQYLSRERLLAAAKTVGDRLIKTALQDEENISWIGLRLLSQKHWTLTPIETDLYDGLPGIALFFAYLGAIAEQDTYTKVAKKSLKTLQYRIESQEASSTLIGGFAGCGGLIYTLTHLGVLWNDFELISQAKKIAETLPELIEQDEKLDVIAGSAGCLLSLISLYHCSFDHKILAAAITCGEHLIANAKPMENGIGWVLKGMGEQPLAGFSHGVAGIALALLQLAELTGEIHFRTAAIAAITYERSLFCPEVGNWWDLRKFKDEVLAEAENQPTCLTAWCHGAPGIGLARLISLPYLDDLKIRSEINTALTTTVSKGFGGNHSLCHGDLGNLELLLQASITLDDPQWQRHADRFAAIILESIDKHGWLCGVPLGVETPGLMTGLAGIGYGLMRLAVPELVPSVLTLAPPNLDKKEPIDQANRLQTYTLSNIS